jgi:hypothetical protein
MDHRPASGLLQERQRSMGLPSNGSHGSLQHALAPPVSPLANSYSLNFGMLSNPGRVSGTFAKTLSDGSTAATMAVELALLQQQQQQHLVAQQSLISSQLLPMLGLGGILGGGASLQGSEAGTLLALQAQQHLLAHADFHLEPAADDTMLLLALQAQQQQFQMLDASPNDQSSPTQQQATGRGGAAANPLYKTELCRSWEETGACRYGAKCQFAHGGEELRQVQRHPKYKTEASHAFFSFLSLEESFLLTSLCGFCL